MYKRIKHNKTSSKTQKLSICKSKKGFGGAASTMIMFIAVISVTTGLVIAFMNYMQSTEQSFTVQSKLSSNKLRTSISISNIYYNSSSSNLYIYVKNVGDTKLSTQLFDVYIDDVFYSDFNVYYADNLSKSMIVLQTQETAAVVKNINLGSGTHEIVVNTEFGVSGSDSFNI